MSARHVTSGRSPCQVLSTETVGRHSLYLDSLVRVHTCYLYLYVVRSNTVLQCMFRCSKQAFASRFLTKMFPVGSTTPCALPAAAIFGLSRGDSIFITVIYIWRLKFLHLKPTDHVSLREDVNVSLSFYEILKSFPHRTEYVRTLVFVAHWLRLNFCIVCRL